MGKALLREYYALCDGGVCQDLLTEEEKKLMAAGKKFYMTGCMQKFDTPNGNGRVYSKKILQRECISPCNRYVVGWSCSYGQGRGS